MSSVFVKGSRAVAIVIAFFIVLWLGGTLRQFVGGPRQPASQRSEAAVVPPPEAPLRPADQRSGTLKGTVIGAGGRVVSYAAINGRGASPIRARADADGRYRIEHLPAGDYELTAAGGGYIALAWGQNATHEPATRVSVGSGTISTADFELPLGGIVSGVVTDLRGNPVPEVSVAINPLPVRPRPKDVRRWVAPNSERRQTTDSEGRFSFDGLEPGDHLVTARAEFDLSDPSGSGRRLVGPVSSSESQPRGVTVTVVAGAAKRLILKMREQGIRVLRGRIVVDGPKRGVLGPVPVRALEHDTTRLVAFSQSSSDGAFVLRGAFLSGAYDLVASSQERDVRPDAAKILLQGSKRIVIDGSDPPEIELRVVRGSQLTGRIELEGANGQPRQPKLKVFMVPKRPLGTMAASIGVSPNAAGEFALNGVAESGYLVTDLSPKSGWAVSGLISNGTDILRDGVEPGQTGLRLKLTNRLGALSGNVMSDGRHFPFAIIVVVAEDRRKWSDPMSRFIRVERSGQDGSFLVEGLLPGNYLVVALSQMERFAEDDDAKLTALLAGSTRVVLTQEVRTVQNLTIVK